MKRMVIAALAAFCMALSCDPNVIPTDPNVGDKPGEMKLTFNKEASSQDFEFQAKGSWEFVSAPKWVSVSPVSGGAGKVSITVACTENDTADDRSGVIYVKDTKSNGDFDVINISVYQYCGDVFDIETLEYYVPYAGGSVTVKVGVNNYYTVKSECDWITCPQTKDITYDNLIFEVAENDGTTPRTGYVTISTEELSQKIAFVQAGMGYYKSVYGARGTGTWCGYCPMVGFAAQKAYEELDGRLIYASFYTESSSSSPTYFNKFSTASSMYSFGDGVPAFVMDNRARTGNMGSFSGTYNSIANFVAEVVELYPAQTGIELSLSLENGKLEMDASVHASSANDYSLNIVLVEDGVIADQSNYDNISDLGITSGTIKNCEHNKVARAFVTPTKDGDKFSLASGEHKDFHYSLDVPAKVINTDNLSIVAYVTRPKTSEDVKGSVKRIDYILLSMLVDNCAICKIGEHTSLRYEE